MKAVTLKHNILQDPETGVYRLQVWVHEYTSETDPYIFVHQKKPLLPDDPGPESPFSNIAAVGDMEEYPKDTPFSSKRPFFRKTFCDILFQDPILMNRIWTELKGDVYQLMDNLNKLDTVTNTSTVEV